MRICISLAIILFSFTLRAQLPQLSPQATIEQVVGLTNVTLEFTRPIARGRTIFGGLVPYGRRWQTGADIAKISFDRPVTIGEHAVPAGQYAIITIPNEKEWTIILSNRIDFTSVSNPDPRNIVAQMCVPVTRPGRFYEALSLELDLTPGNAELYISWTDVQVSIPISTPVNQEVTNYVDSLLAAPLADDGQPYFRATNYLMFHKQELTKALALTDRFKQLEQGYFIYTMRRDIYVALGDIEQAIKENDQAIVLARREFAGEPLRVANVVRTLQEEREQLDNM